MKEGLIYPRSILGNGLRCSYGTEVRWEKYFGPNDFPILGVDEVADLSEIPSQEKTHGFHRAFPEVL